MAKKILIVGSQGYLGSHLVGYLSSRGYECKGIDTGFFSKGMLREIYSEDVVNKDARAIVKDDLNGFDVLILLAGISNDPFGRLSADQIYNPSRCSSNKSYTARHRLSNCFYHGKTTSRSTYRPRAINYNS